MARYQAVQSSWEDRTLYPESIPHLFHHDLFYLWLLEREPMQRPRGWRDRIECWRLLAELLLAGELDIEEEPITGTFAKFAGKYGVERVSWLRPRRPGAKRIGVLSPTVLVRPLPDANEKTLDEWRRDLPNPRIERPDELKHFVHLALQSLGGEAQREEGTPTFRQRLTKILRRELESSPMASPPGGRAIRVPILRALGWAEPGELLPPPESLDLLVRGEGRSEGKIFVPRCRLCNRPLPRAESAVPIVVTASAFTVQCAEESCLADNPLELSQFYLWYRESNRDVVIWKDDLGLRLPQGAPPERAIEGNELRLRWNPVHVDGRSDRRFLRLRFPDRRLFEQPLSGIFYQRLLVAGDEERFHGLPIQLDWFDALEKPDGVHCELKGGADGPAIFRDLMIAGLPVPFDKSYGSLEIRREPALGLGVFPDSKVVPAGWLWYRTFLEGAASTSYALFPVAARTLPTVQEFLSGVGQAIAIVAEDGLAGVSYTDVAPIATGSADRPTATVEFGVDFGTSHSLVAFARPERGGTTETITVRPAEVRDAVRWLAPRAKVMEESQRKSLQTLRPAFLPPADYRNNADDPHLVPSALWAFPGGPFIRWNDLSPHPSAEPIAGFKWDPPQGDYQSERHSYLAELLFLSLPLAFRDLGSARRFQVAKLGFAFPLAFDVKARAKFATLFQDLAESLNKRTGLEYGTLHLDESWACVNGIGKLGTGDTYLVADMGGGTLDVVIFLYRGRPDGRPSVEIRQIGSLRFGGERFLRAVVAKKGSGRDGLRQMAEFERKVWEFRDLIAEGRGQDRYGTDEEVAVVVERFYVLSLEFIRTMVASERARNSGEVAPIHLLLAGNGWRLTEATSTRAKSVRGFVEKYFKDIVHDLSEPGIVLYDGDALKDLKSPKHLVVRGALANAAGGGRHDLTDEKENGEGKLPAGRRIKVPSLGDGSTGWAWSDLVGEGEPPPSNIPEVEPAQMQFDLADAPPMSESWRRQLLRALSAKDNDSIPYPDPPTLRSQIQVATNRPRRILKGPLQAILEGKWAEKLSE